MTVATELVHPAHDRMDCFSFPFLESFLVLPQCEKPVSRLDCDGMVLDDIQSLIVVTIAAGRLIH